MKKSILSFGFLPLCMLPGVLLALSSCVSGNKHGAPAQIAQQDSFQTVCIDPEEEYHSSEQDEYYKKITSDYPGLPTKKEVLDFRTDYCRITAIGDYSPYEDSMTPYREKLFRTPSISFPGDADRYDTIDKVPKYFIIKHDKQGSQEAFIYTDSEYSEVGDGSDLWIAISRDSGKSWKYYYTGLTENQPLCPKWYSKLPLWVDDHTLQIEAAMLQQTDRFSLPCGFPAFAVAKDGILMTFDLHLLAKDSDNDGMTDIEERKLRTDPFRRDTNGNGISDTADLNPRHNEPRMPWTDVYEALIDYTVSGSGLPAADLYKWFDLKSIPGQGVADHSMQTVLIVNDDPAMPAVQPKHVRAIILTEKEYVRTKDPKFVTELKRLYISPLFRVDGKPDMRIVSCSYSSWGATYVVEKTEKGWRMKTLSTEIS